MQQVGARGGLKLRFLSGRSVLAQTFALLFATVLAVGCGQAEKSGQLVGTPRVLEVNPVPTVAARPTPTPSLPLGPTYYMLYLGMNFEAPQFGDERIREAVRLAVDRDLVHSSAQRDFPERQSRIQGSIVSPSSLVPERDRTEDLKLAAQLLSDAGRAGGFKATLYVLPALEWAAQIVAEQMSDIDFAVDIRIIERDEEFLAALRDGEADLFLTEAEGTLTQPVDLLKRLLDPDVPENYTRFSSDRFVGLSKASLFSEAEKVALDHAPSILPLIRYHIPFLQIHESFSIVR